VKLSLVSKSVVFTLILGLSVGVGWAGECFDLFRAENFDAAVTPCQKEAEQGIAIAQYSLGVMYFNSHGVPQNDVKALEWYTKAAEQGVADAQYMLGFWYDFGEGVPEDDAKAVEWYTKAAEQGHDRAQYTLGSIYAGGKDDPKNDAKAAEWWTKAAEQGHADAQNSLGWVYYPDHKRNSKNRDLWNPVMSYAWYNLAAIQGDRISSMADIVALDMTPEQIAEAEALSSKWHAEIEARKKAKN